MSQAMRSEYEAYGGILAGKLFSDLKDTAERVSS